MVVFRYDDGTTQTVLIEEDEYQKMVATEAVINDAWVSYLRNGKKEAHYWACVEQNDYGED